MYLPAHPRGERIETVTPVVALLAMPISPRTRAGSGLKLDLGDGERGVVGISPRTRAGSGLKQAQIRILHGNHLYLPAHPRGERIET